MMQTGTFQDFLDGKIAVMVPSSKSRQYKALMQKCAERNLVWACGDAPAGFTPLGRLKNLCISTFRGDLVYETYEDESLRTVQYDDLIF